MSTDELHTPSIEHDFSDIAPYDDHQFHEKIAKLVNEPGFEHAVRYVMPDVDYKAFTDMLLTVKNRDDFQVKPGMLVDQRHKPLSHHAGAADDADLVLIHNMLLPPRCCETPLDFLVEFNAVLYYNMGM